MNITINGHDIFSEYKMNYLGRTIAAAVPKVKTVDIPLADGSLDLTEALSGTIHYENRTIEIRFELRVSRGYWLMYYKALQKDFNGETVEVIFADDPEYKWTGRCAVGALEDHKSTAGIVLTINAEPFKKTLASDVYVVEVGQTSETLQIVTSEQRTYVTLQASVSTMSVTFDGESFMVPTTEKSIFGLYFTTGTHSLMFTGAGTVTVKTFGGAL